MSAFYSGTVLIRDFRIEVAGGPSSFYWFKVEFRGLVFKNDARQADGSESPNLEPSLEAAVAAALASVSGTLAKWAAYTAHCGAHEVTGADHSDAKPPEVT